MSPMTSGNKRHQHKPDWSVLELDGVMDMVTKVAARASRDDIPLLGADDLEQEAFIILSTRADEARVQYDHGGPRHLGAWLRKRLLNATETEVLRAGKQLSYEAVREGVNPDLV